MSSRNGNRIPKPMKTGVINLGYEYEKLVPAFFALELLKDVNVRWFEIELNASSFGKFDDLVITVTTMDNYTERFAIQLKHREEGKNKVDAENEFNRRDTNKKPKGFNIAEYMRTFACQDKEIQDNYNFVLFTNVEFLNLQKVQKYEIVASPQALGTKLFNVDGVYRFKKRSGPDTAFYERFFLVSRQKNVNEIERAIAKTFAEDFHSDERTMVCYINFFQHLHKKQFNDTKIGRDAVILNLTNLLVSNWAISPSLTKSVEPRIELLENAFKMFDVTVLPESLTESIADNWKYKVPETDEELLLLAHEFKFVKENGKISVPILCFLQKTPLFLHLNPQSEKIIYSILPLLKTLEHHNISLVLIGQKVDQNRLEGWKVFRTLRDVASNERLYQKFLETVNVSLQGRDTKTLKQLEHDNFCCNLTELITPTELLSTLNGHLSIGIATEQLPVFYIPRPLIRSEVTVDQLKHLSTQKTTVIHCGGNSKTFKLFLKSKNLPVDYTYDGKLILTDETQIKNGQHFAHHLKLSSANTLQWMENKVDPTRASNFEHPINILYGQPGIGKTTMLKFLARNCPPKYWVVTVPLQQISFCFKTKLGTKEILKLFLDLSKQNETDERFCRYFLKDKRIVFFIDGLNELDSNSIVKAMQVLEELAREGYKIWVSCTTFLKNFRDGVFKTSQSYTIEGVTKVEQEEYVSRRLKCASIHQDTINQVTRKLFSNNGENLDILKTPLLLFLLTEILSNHEKIGDLQETFTINQMYESFFEGKLQHNLRKADHVLDRVIEGFKRYHLRGYQMIALHICLEPELLKSLEIKLDKAFIRDIKENSDFLGILKISENNTFIFSHYTYAEYFAAMWFSENFDELPYRKIDFILKPEYDGIRKFFDAKLAESCPLHLAVLDQDISRVEKYALSFWNEVDKGGRTPLHLSVSLGRKHPLLSEKVSKNTDNRFTIHEKILRYLLVLAKAEDLLKKDKLLDWNLFQYADASLCLSSLEELSKKGNFDWSFLETNGKNISTFIYYCVTLGYPNLLRLAMVDRGLPELYNHYQEKPLLHLALESNQLEVATLFIANGANLSQVDSQGHTPLHHAAMWGQAEIVQVLLKKGVDVEARNILGRTALDLAARMGHKNVLELLIRNDAKIDSKDKEMNTPLQIAAYLGRTEILKFLVEKGADVNSTNKDRKYALHRAAAMGHCEAVKYLIRNGTDKDVVDKYKNSALHYAAYGGHEDVVRFLVSQNVNIFARDEDVKTAKEIAMERGHTTIAQVLTEAEENAPRTLPSLHQSNLHDAAQVGDLETIQRLVEAGTNIEETNRDNDTPLHIASREGHLHVVAYLLSQNANPAATNDDLRVPLHLAAQRGQTSVVKKLLNRGQNAAPDKWGITPLHRVAYKGHMPVVQMLVESGVDINSVCYEGATPLHSAARGGHIDVIEYLLSKGALIGKKNNNKETCLHVGVQRGWTDAVKYLIQKEKSIIDEVDNQQQTALHFAAQKGYKDMVQCLVEGGADVNKRDKFLETALDVAENAGQGNIVEFLRLYRK